MYDKIPVLLHCFGSVFPGPCPRNAREDPDKDRSLSRLLTALTNTELLVRSVHTFTVTASSRALLIAMHDVSVNAPLSTLCHLCDDLKVDNCWPDALGTMGHNLLPFRGPLR